MFFLLFFMIFILFSIPVILLHGHRSDALDTLATKVWVPYSRGQLEHSTVFTEILDEKYNGYMCGKDKSGDYISFNSNSILPSQSEENLIFNFSYYTGKPSVIGDGKLLPLYGGYRKKYEKNLQCNSYSKNLAVFVKKVLISVYGEDWTRDENAKVNFVAHCMGGVVLRYAIKFLNIPGTEVKFKDVVGRVCYVASPSNGFSNQLFGEEALDGDFTWQKYGEDLEMNIPPSKLHIGQDIIFCSDNNERGTFCGLIGNDNLGVESINIYGTRNHFRIKLFFGVSFCLGPDDGDIYFRDTYIEGAENLAVHASHSYSLPHKAKSYFLFSIMDEGAVGEEALTSNSEVKQIIKDFILSGNKN
jgi:hypothetical protein